VRAAYSAFLPSLDVSEGAGKSGGATFFQGQLVPYAGDPWHYGKGYSARMTLFDGGRNWLNLRAARATSASDEQAEVTQRYAVALNVKQQYFAVLAARELETAAEQQLAEAQKALDVTVAQVAGGAKSRSDSLHSAVQVGIAKLAVIRARGQLITANSALTRLVGTSFEVTATPADTAVVPSIDIDSVALVEMAVTGPSVLGAEHVAAASKDSRWASLSRYLPSISVAYSFSTNWSSETFLLGGGSQQNSHGLSFSASYSIFDGFQREASVVQASASADNAKYAMRDARLAARENLAQYLATFHTAQETIDLQLLQIESAEEDVSAQEAKYAAGAAALVDVLTAQSALATARQQLIQARLDARTAKAQIEAIIGKDIQ
jgi:outer membrane protein